MRPRVLLVGNGGGFLPALTRHLQQDGCDCLTAPSGRDALAQQETQKPDAVVLELELPDMKARALCRRLRARSTAPILVASRSGGTDDRATVSCLAAGADTVLVDPGNLELAHAQLHAQLRRAREYPQHQATGVILDLGTLKIDLNGREALLAGQPLCLSPKEFELLAALAVNEGRAMRSSELLRQVWGYEPCCRTRTLQVHIGRLRSKMEADPRRPRIIVTVNSVGYRLCRP